MNNSNRSIVIAVVLVVIVGALVWQFGGASAPKTASAQTVATVNGEAITQTQLLNEETQIAAQVGAASTSPDSFQTPALDTLVSQVLLKQAAIKAGVTASSTEVDQQLASVQSGFKSAQEFQTALTQKGLTVDGLRQQIADSLQLNTFLEQQLHLSAATTTETAVKQAYDKQASQMKSPPPLSQVHDQVAKALVQQEQQKIVSAYIDTLKQSADITYFISTSTPAAAAPAATTSAQ